MLEKFISYLHKIDGEICYFFKLWDVYKAFVFIMVYMSHDLWSEAEIIHFSKKILQSKYTN